MSVFLGRYALAVHLEQLYYGYTSIKVYFDATTSDMVQVRSLWGDGLSAGVPGRHIL